MPTSHSASKHYWGRGVRINLDGKWAPRRCLNCQLGHHWRDYRCKVKRSHLCRRQDSEDPNLSQNLQEELLRPNIGWLAGHDLSRRYGPNHQKSLHRLYNQLEFHSFIRHCSHYWPSHRPNHRVHWHTWPRLGKNNDYCYQDWPPRWEFHQQFQANW